MPRKKPKPKPEPAGLTLVAALQRALDLAGITRAELARRLGMQPSSFTDLFHGRAGIGDARLAKIAEATGTVMMCCGRDNWQVFLRTPEVDRFFADVD